MPKPKKTIAITGAQGALGRYAALYFRYHQNFDVIEVDRTAFNDAVRLEDAILRAEIVLHFAGINRASDAEILAGNPALATTLIAALQKTRALPLIIYASSTHEDRGTSYGRSKRLAGELLDAWASTAGGSVVRLVLPHIYSEFARANYNSGIATFCRSVAAGGIPQVDADTEITPMHAWDICETIVALMESPSQVARPVGIRRRMSDILAEISAMHELYVHRQIVPDLRQPERLHLFNTYRTHLYDGIGPTRPVLHADARGTLFEAVKELNGGQTFISSTGPSVTRGNHFHFHKVERFCVLRGEAVIRMRRMGNAQVSEFKVSGDQPCFIDIPTLWTHNITNVGATELLTLFWTHEIFDAAAPDTYAVDVETPASNC